MKTIHYVLIVAALMISSAAGGYFYSKSISDRQQYDRAIREAEVLDSLKMAHRDSTTLLLQEIADLEFSADTLLEKIETRKTITNETIKYIDRLPNSVILDIADSVFTKWHGPGTIYRRGDN